MSFFRQSADQLREAFTAMPMQSRVIAGMLVVAIALGLGMLVRGSTTPAVEPLFGGRTFSEKELDTMEMAFSQAGLRQWNREGRRLLIPVANRNEYLTALQNETTLSHSVQSNLQAAIESTSPFESSDQRHSREMAAKERDISNLINRFPFVAWASVEHDQGQRLGLSREAPQSARVVVTPEGSSALSRDQKDMIQDVVWPSYAGMTADDVVVIDTNGTASSTADAAEDPLLRKRREEEANLVQKVRAQLSGYGRIQVQAYVEIDPTMAVEKTVLKYADQPTTLGEHSRSVESVSTRPLNRGVPGTVPNAIGNRAASIDENAQTSRVEEDERESTRVAGQEYEQSSVAALQVKRARVSIGLPSSYYRKVWAQNFRLENPGKAAEDVPVMQAADLQQLRETTELNIQNAITPLLPDIAAGEDRLPLVEVFDYTELPEPIADKPKTAELALTWLANSWQTIALVILGLVALLVARGAARGGSLDRVPAEYNEGFGLEIPAAAPDSGDEAGEPDQMTITGGSLKDELANLVENNPEVAANVIRGWVAEAA